MELEDIGDGNDPPDDPGDESLYHVTAYVQVDPSTRDPMDAGRVLPGNTAVWVPVPDASYCTQLPCTSPDTIHIQAPAYLLDQFWGVLAAHPEHSVKKLGKRFSWIAPGDFPETSGGSRVIWHCVIPYTDADGDSAIYRVAVPPQTPAHHV